MCEIKDINRTRVNRFRRMESQKIYNLINFSFLYFLISLNIIITLLILHLLGIEISSTIKDNLDPFVIKQIVILVIDKFKQNFNPFVIKQIISFIFEKIYDLIGIIIPNFQTG